MAVINTGAGGETSLLRGAGYLRGTVWPHLPETKHRDGVSAPREGGGPSYGRGGQTWRESLDREHREIAAFLGVCLH